MIEVKATADIDRGGCVVNVSLEGHGEDLIEEALAVIQGVMVGLKNEDILLYALTLKSIIDNSSILTGDEDGKAREFEKFVATTKFREGVN